MACSLWEHVAAPAALEPCARPCTGLERAEGKRCVGNEPLRNRALASTGTSAELRRQLHPPSSAGAVILQFMYTRTRILFLQYQCPMRQCLITRATPYLPLYASPIALTIPRGHPPFYHFAAPAAVAHFAAAVSDIAAAV